VSASYTGGIYAQYCQKFKDCHINITWENAKSQGKVVAFVLSGKIRPPKFQAIINSTLLHSWGEWQFSSIVDVNKFRLFAIF